MFDDKNENRREYAIHFLDSIGAHTTEDDLCMREFSKSLMICLHLVCQFKTMLNAQLGASRLVV